MTLSIPFRRSPSRTQDPPPTVVKAVSQMGVQWDRPIFKAPPLMVEIPVPVVEDFANETVEMIRGRR
jgi:hypothetical protein